MRVEELLELIPERKCKGCDESYTLEQLRAIPNVVDCCPDGRLEDKIFNSCRQEIAEKLAPLVCRKPSKENILKAIIRHCAAGPDYPVTDFEIGLAEEILKEVGE